MAPNTRGNAAIAADEALDVDVICAAADWQARHPGATEASVAAARAAFAFAGGGDLAEVCILLTDDAHMAELNARFRGVPGATNVLAFTGDDGPSEGGRRRLGDIAIGLETVEREAVAEGKAVLDHLRHLVVHGMLHLLGYEHDTDAGAETMERAEVAILAALGVGDPYGEGDGNRP